MTGAPLGWFGIVRLGLVQAALGAIVVLTTSTLNRVMVVELALPAAVPGAESGRSPKSFQVRFGESVPCRAGSVPLV